MPPGLASQPRCVRVRRGGTELIYLVSSEPQCDRTRAVPAPIALGLTNDERYANTHLLFSSIQTNGPTPEPGLGTPQRGRASPLRIRSTCWIIIVLGIIVPNEPPGGLGLVRGGVSI